jgi:hypothetical protein
LPSILFVHISLKGVLLEIANAGFCKEAKCIEDWKERMINAFYVFHILKVKAPRKVKTGL